MNKQKKMKKKVKQSFDLGSVTYDKFSEVQKQVGQYLLDFFLKSFPKKKNYEFFKSPIRVLDLGCGTGEFSRKIMSKFLIDRIRLIDISSEMIKYSKIKIKEKNGEFLVCDFDKYFEFKKFNMIVSNMALHWSSDINKLLKKIILNMSKESFFLFSVPNNKSFSNFKKLLPINIKNKIFNNFPEDDKIFGLRKNKNISINIKKMKILRKYLHPLHFLKEMRKLGVTVKINNEQQNLFFLKKIDNKEFFLDYDISLYLVKKNEP
tara:strand:+ start:1217 stop:2005 length:789 start_codon:yes stop_codon:yes gene_type:complete